MQDYESEEEIYEKYNRKQTIRGNEYDNEIKIHGNGANMEEMIINVICYCFQII